MTLFIQTTDFKKIAQCEFENFYASYIDFDQQEWQFIQRPNEENDVEISYLFQFDRIEHSDYTEIKIEIFHNGMDEAFIQNNILNVIQSHLPNVHYYFD